MSRAVRPSAWKVTYDTPPIRASAISVIRPPSPASPKTASSARVSRTEASA